MFCNLHLLVFFPAMLTIKTGNDDAEEKHKVT